MKNFTRFMWSVALTAMLLAGVLASAQRGKAKDAKSSAGSAQPAGQNAAAVSGEKARSKSPLYEDKRSGTNPLYESQNGKAKSVLTLDAGSKDAAKMTSGSMGNVKNNPLYEQKSEGTNPLYERPDSALKTQEGSASGPQNVPGVVDGQKQTADKKNVKATSPSIGNHKDVVEYKDGEDGTMHTRPASHK